jgi:hypothetical protein
MYAGLSRAGAHPLLRQVRFAAAESLNLSLNVVEWSFKHGSKMLDSVKRGMSLMSYAHGGPSRSPQLRLSDYLPCNLAEPVDSALSNVLHQVVRPY